MAGRPVHRSRRSLLWRIFALNAAVLVVAWAVLAFSPARVESPLVNLWEGIAGVAGLTLMLVVNLFLLRRVFAPLEQLRALMRTADPLRPGPRLPSYGDTNEVAELAESFNDMLERLERERRESAGRALAAQEAERRRVAGELHDEVGQSLTAVLLQLEHASRRASPEVVERLEAARESARGSIEEVRRLAQRLRPEALDDLGLGSALAHLAEPIAAHPDVELVQRIARDLPDLSPEAELVVYRVAQEGLTNAVRHSGASRVELSLERSARGAELRVIDDGRGINGASEGVGITGMRERALLVGATLEITSRNGRGVEVRLDVPAAS